MFADWRAAGDAAGEFAAFRALQGTSFERHCLYFALRAHMLAEGLGAGDWHGWPQPYQDSRAAVVARFARTHAEEVTWVAWQQWLADRQLAAAAGAAEPMRVGLYRDLAVGANAAGAETWAERDLVVHALHIGAPPDAGSETGQEWGLPPPHPERLRASGYRSFVELLRANMRHAGALRIDHVMALERLYVIPKGAPAAAGTYLDYPFADLAGITALESVRSRCLIIGEDLGDVPHGFRERMAELQMLSYRVLRFERHGHRFLGPHEYPTLAVAVFGNHDLPTLRGWWESAAARGAGSAARLAARRRTCLRATWSWTTTPCSSPCTRCSAARTPSWCWCSSTTCCAKFCPSTRPARPTIPVGGAATRGRSRRSARSRCSRRLPRCSAHGTAPR